MNVLLTLVNKLYLLTYLLTYLLAIKRQPQLTIEICNLISVPQCIFVNVSNDFECFKDTAMMRDVSFQFLV